MEFRSRSFTGFIAFHDSGFFSFRSVSTRIPIVGNINANVNPTAMDVIYDNIKFFSNQNGT
jgi:hypothetical protein